MLTLTSPKITVGVHCAKLRTQRACTECRRGPRRVKVLRPIRQNRLLVRDDPDRVRARRRAGSSGCVPQRTRVLQVLSIAGYIC
jgi:hypothetical protein